MVELEIGPDSRAPQTGVKYKDLEVLMQLAELGANLTAPRHVLYYLYFPNQAAAESAARAAAERSFETTVDQSTDGELWRVVSERRGYVLSMDVVRDNTDFFEGLAERLGGEYDNWEASAD
jgi:hypothetical protein